MTMRTTSHVCGALLLVSALLIPTHASAQNVLTEPFKADSLERIYLNIPVVDMPYQATVAKETDNGWQALWNQSMATSLDLSEDMHVASHYAIRKIFKERRYSRFVAYAWDFLSMYLPFGTGWTHEEYHRAVMGLRGVSSFDEIWKMQLFGSTVSVSHETDEGMARLHDHYIKDFVRMNAAGLEGQMHLNQRLQRNDFFYHRNMMNEVTMWMNVINNYSYVSGCADPETDDIVNEMNEKETQVKQRDFTGMDLSAWAYELFHPGVTYAQRGTHPSGVGIDRYITYDMIGEEGVAYLKKQSNREWINAISPMMFGIRRIPLFRTKAGRWYGNFAGRHYLTHFGDDISFDLMFETPKLNFIVAPHVYSNYVKSFPGMEFGIEDKRFMDDRLRLSATAQLWSQPDEFTTTKGKFGGLISADVSYVFARRWEAYGQITGKTDGWVAGNVYLDKNLSFRAGLRWLMRN